MEPLIEDRIQKLEKRGLVLHPCIITIEEKKLVDFCVYFDAIFYKCQTLLNALDLLFKVYHVLNLNYPPEAEPLWLFIQQALFQIHTPYDKSFQRVSELLVDFQETE